MKAPDHGSVPNLRTRLKKRRTETIGLFLPKQRWLTFEGFVEAEKCFLQCLRPKRWTEFRSDCSENCDCTVGRQRFEDSDI